MLYPNLWPCILFIFLSLSLHSFELEARWVRFQSCMIQILTEVGRFEDRWLSISAVNALIRERAKKVKIKWNWFTQAHSAYTYSIPSNRIHTGKLSQGIENLRVILCCMLIWRSSFLRFTFIPLAEALQQSRLDEKLFSLRSRCVFKCNCNIITACFLVHKSALKYIYWINCIKLFIFVWVCVFLCV